MFTLPPRPPKDYQIKTVTKSLVSSSQFTPESLPRVTQPNLGKFCSPIEYKDDEVVVKTAPDVVEPIIMDKWTKEARAMWVVNPGKDDFFLHDVYKKYSILEDSKSYDPRYKHKENVFNRSYKYELDCIEAARLEKVRDKCEREFADYENSFQKLVHEKEEKEKPRIKVKTCKEEPPFWWKTENEIDSLQSRNSHVENFDGTGSTTYKTSYLRWQEEPNLTAFVMDDPCRRKYDMHTVGQPFRTEACNWYYENYPPPDIKFRSKKFV